MLERVHHCKSYKKCCPLNEITAAGRQEIQRHNEGWNLFLIDKVKESAPPKQAAPVISAGSMRRLGRLRHKMNDIPHIKTENALVEFEKHPIRRFYDEAQERWYFSVIDAVAALTDSVNPRDYWFKMKIRVKTEDGFELSTICRQLKLKAPDGKLRETDCEKTLKTKRAEKS